MGLLDQVIGGVLGGGAGPGPLQSVLGQILGGGPGGAAQAGSQGGLAGLIEQFSRAGLGHVVKSWVGTGPNQQISPQQVGQVFGQDQVNQWSQQTGMSQDSVLSSLSQVLPHAVDQSTPNGEVPSSSPFDEPGLELPPGR